MKRLLFMLTLVFAMGLLVLAKRTRYVRLHNPCPLPRAILDQLPADDPSVVEQRERDWWRVYYPVVVGLWCGSYVTAAGAVWWLARRHARAALHCGRCGYELRVLPDVCPNCGLDPGAASS